MKTALRASFLLLLSVSAIASEVINNASVVRMVEAGLGAELVVLKIEQSEAAFDTSTDGLIALRNAHVPDVVIRAMLFKPDSPKAQSAPASDPVAVRALPTPTRGGETCAAVKLFTPGNDGLSWVPSTVCVAPTGLSLDEQTIALGDIVVQCRSNAAVLSMGSSLLRGDAEWWVSDTRETLKFRGTPDAIDNLSSALTHARSDIPHGGCGDRDVRRRLTLPR